MSIVKTVACAFALVFLALTAACSTAVDPTNPYDPSAPADQQAKGQVSGLVKLERAKEYAGALVTLEGTSQTGMTGADGSFKLTGVPAGTYALAVARQGYRTQRVPAVSVKLGAKTDVGEILVLVARGLVRGSVSLKDAGGEGNGGALVTLKSADPDAAQDVPEVPAYKALFDPKAETIDAGTGVAAGESFGAISGNDGTWEIGNVPAGQYFLLVSKDGYQTACMGLVTIVKDGEEKSLGLLELTGSSALVRFADSAGLDLEPYKTDGAVRYYTNDKGLKARFTAAGAVRMRVGWSAAAVDAASYEAFAVEKDVALSADEMDGAKTLYVDLRDQCGMERRYTASLTLDTAAPEVVGAEVVADEGLDGKRYVRAADGQVTVRLSGEDKGSGLAGYRLTIDKAPTDEAYIAIPGSWNVVTGLGTEQREYEVYAEYRDRAGNAKTAGPVKVTLDSTAPEAGEPPVVVENGVDVGGKRTVYDDYAALKFAVTGAAQFSLGAASGTGSWQDFAETSRISLAGRARGDVRQYVKFRDQAKNETAEYTVEYVYETQGNVRGKVTLEGSGDPTTVSVLLSAAGASAVNPDANGDYAVFGVERGSYTIKLSAAGFEDAQQLVLVNAGKDATVPDAQLKRARGTLKGTFTLAGAQSHAGITVKVAEAGLSLETAADGSFELKNMVAQQYTVSASKYGYLNINGQAVTVPSGGTGTAAGGALQVALTGAISGIAACDVGTCGAAALALTGTRFDGQSVTQNGTANADGTFTLNGLPAGDYEVAATLPGYSSSKALATVSPDGTRQAGTLLMPAQRGSASGIAQAAGTPAQGIQVAVTGTSTIGLPVNATTASGPAGAFALDGLLVGTYTLGATLADYNGVSQQVTIAVDANTNVGTLNLTVNPGTVTGVALLEGGGDATAITVTVDGANPVNPNGSGSYIIGNLPAGTRTVTGALTGYYSASTTVVVKAGQSVAATPLTLMRARGKVAGQVTLQGQWSSEGAMVVLAKGSVRFATATAATGDYEISGVPVDSGYDVTVSKDGFLSKHVTGVTVEADKTTTLAMIVLETVTGDFNFLHCAHWSTGDKQLVSLLGEAYVTGCTAASGGPSVRLDLNPPSGMTKLQWALQSDFSDQTEVNWDAMDPPEVDLGTSSGTVKVYVKYFVPTNTPQWTDPFSAGVFIDLEVPVLDDVVVQNDPPYLTPTRTYMHLSVQAHDPLSSGEDGSGVRKHALVVGGGACPADGAAYSLTPADIETGAELSVQVVSNPGLESEGTKTVRVCVRDSAGNLAAWADRTIVFDKTAPVAGAFGFYLDRTDLTADTLTNMRNVVLKAAVTTDHAPLSGVAFATAGFDCDTATYETPDVVSDTPSGTQHAYVIAKDWVLSGSDGMKKANICLKDVAGNVTGASTETSPAVELDTAAPETCGIVLRGGEPSTNATDIAVTLRSSDPAGQVWLSGDVDAVSALPVNQWIAYAANPAQALRLSAGDGVKTVTVKCRDVSGNVSAVNFATILLDRVPPAGYVSINGGADYVQASDVTVTLTGFDDRTGVSKYKLSNDGTLPDCGNQTGYINFAGTVNNWPLVDTEGARAVTLCLMDGAGNTALVGTDSIYLDKTNPAGTLAINGTDQYTNTLTVMLAFSGVSGDAVQMKVSNASMTCGTETGLAAYSPLVQHLLAAGADGNRTVYACLKDASGRVNAATISDTITLDTAAPSVTAYALVGGDYTTTTAATLSMTVTGVAEMRISGDVSAIAGGTPNAWMTYNAPNGVTLTSGDGPKTVTAQFRDTAGNVTSLYSDAVTLDQTRPTGVLTINNGDAKTASLLSTLTITAAGDTEKMYLSNDPIADCAAIAMGSFTDYVSVKVWTLKSGADGARSVYACLRDYAGNTNANPTTVTDGITVDTTPPGTDATSLSINEGDQTQVRAINLSMHTTDGTTTGYTMYIEGDVEAAAGATYEWVPYATSKAVTLTPSQGLKQVRVRFKDDVGNISAAASDTITYDNAGPEIPTISINEGDITKASAVNLTLFASGAATMCVFGDVKYTGDLTAWRTVVDPNLAGNIGKECFTNSWWETYATSKASGTLRSANASNTVYVIYKDAAGNITSTISDAIYYDTTVPAITSPTVTGVVAGSQASTTLTGTPNVTLTWTVTGAGRMSGGAFDGAAAPTEMAFANIANLVDPATACSSLSYEPYATSKAWTLTVGSSPDNVARYVDLCFKDQAGNYAASARGIINLDLVAPTLPQLTITQGEYATSTAVTVNLNATGATQYYIEGDVTDTSSTFEWKAGAFPVNGLGLTLAGTDGTKVVMARYRDAAGNESAAAIDTIQLDTALPSGTVSINNGAAYTNNALVTLSTTTSAADIVAMDVKNASTPCADGSRTYATTFSNQVTYTLPAGEGTKTVYVCHLDRAGNKSAAETTDTIEYDTIAPAITSVTIPAYSLTSAATITNSVTHATAFEMRFYGDITAVAGGAVGAWRAYAASQVVTLNAAADGLKAITAEFRDSAGNVSSALVTTTLDTVKPSGTVNINSGAAYTNNALVTLTTATTDLDITAMDIKTTNLACADGSRTYGTTYSNQVTYTLTGGEGSNAIWVCYQDRAGNKSTSNTTAGITYDVTAPAITSVTVPEYSLTTIATITNNVTHATAFEMRFYGDITGVAGGSVGVWKAYAASQDVSLSTTDGLKAITAEFKDSAGNLSSALVTTTLDRTLPSGTVSINTGAAYTGTALVTVYVTTSFTDIVSVDIKESALACSDAGRTYPTTYSDRLSATLSGGDGAKTLYVCFKDRAGNKSAAYASDGITLDTAPPTGESITVAAIYTNQTVHAATIGASDTYTVSQMYIDGDVVADANTFQWITYATSKSVTLLSSTQGAKTVRVRFRDGALNESLVATDIVTYDTAAPSGTSLVIAGGAGYTSITGVTLTPGATDATSGMYQMRFSRCADFNLGGACNRTAWVAYDTAYGPYTLTTGGAGTYPVYAQFSDNASNLTTTNPSTITDSIYYDPTDPNLASIEIRSNTGAATEYVNNGSVRVYLTVTEAESGLDKILIGEAPPGLADAVWLPYPTAGYATFTLSPGDDVKTVQVQVMDKSGRTSVVRTDIVTLDTTAPQVLSFTTTTPFVSANSATFELDATDNYSNKASIQICKAVASTYNCKTQCSAWEAWADTKTWALTFATGANKVALCLKDEVGNIGAPSFVTVTKDTTAPSAPVLSTPVMESGIARLNWAAAVDAESGIASYEVTYAVDCNSCPGGGATVTTISGITGTSYIVRDLKNYVPYRFTVYAYNNAGVKSAGSSSSGTNVPGWTQDDFVDFNGDISATLAEYNGTYYILEPVAGPQIDMLHCDTRKYDCMNTDNWARTTVNSTSGTSLDTKTQLAFARGSLVLVPAMVQLYGYDAGSGVTAIRFKFCDLTQSQCTDSGDFQWPADIDTGTAGQFFDSPTALAYEGSHIAAVYAKDDGTGTKKITTAVCNYEPDSLMSCSAAGFWNKVVHGAAKVGESADIQFAGDRLVLAYHNSVDDVRIGVCKLNPSASYTDECDTAAKWNLYAIDVTAGEKFNPKVATDGDNIWVAYSRTNGSSRYIKVQYCNITASNCDADTDWASYTLTSDVDYAGEPAMFQYSRGMLHLVWGANSRAFYASCSTSTGCNTASDWTEYKYSPAVFTPQVIATGVSTDDYMIRGVVTETDPFVVSKYGNKPYAAAVGPQLPVPGGYFAAPSLNQVHLGWRKVGGADGHEIRYGSASRTYDSSLTFGSGQESADVALNSDTYVTIKSTSGDAISDPGTEFMVHRLATFTASTAMNAGSDGNVMAAIIGDWDANGPVNAIYETSGGVYKDLYCTANCKDAANWSATGYNLFTDAGAIFMKGASGLDNLFVATYDNANVTVRYCPTTTGCDAVTDWTTVDLLGDPTLTALDVVSDDDFLSAATCGSLPDLRDSGTGAEPDPAGGGTNDFDTNDVSLVAAAGNTLVITADSGFPTTANLGAYRITAVAGQILTVTNMADAVVDLFNYGLTESYEIYSTQTYGATGTLNPATTGSNDFDTGKATGSFIGDYLVITHWSPNAAVDGMYYIYNQVEDGDGTEIVYVRNLDGTVPAFTNETNVQFSIVTGSGRLKTWSCSIGGGLCATQGGWKLVEQSSYCKSSDHWRGLDVTTDGTYMYVLEAQSGGLDPFLLRRCSTSTNCDSAGEFTSYSWAGGITVQEVLAFDANPNTDELMVLFRTDMPPFQQLQLGYCDVGTSGCLQARDWSFVVIADLFEAPTAASVFRKGNVFVVQYSTATEMRGVVCHDECHRTDSWTSYPLRSLFHEPINGVYSGPLLFSNFYSSVNYIHALFPYAVGATKQLYVGVGGRLDVTADP